MAWRVAKSILTLHAQLKRGAPRAAPPATPADAWGTIGDAVHDPTSDHSPHDLPGLGDGVVTAGDFPDVPDLGLDARKVLDDIRRSRDPRVKYGISHGQMFSSYPTSSYPAWTWRPYSGKDGHFTHGHLSVVGDARADGTQPWQTIGGEIDVNLDDKISGTETNPAHPQPRSVKEVLMDAANLRAVLYGEKQAPAGTPLARLLTPAVQPEPATVQMTSADRAAIVADVVDQLAERLGALRFVAEPPA